MTMYLRRRASFSAGIGEDGPVGGHSFRGGHNYICELTIAGKIHPETGMVVNIRDIDTLLKSRVVEPLHGKILDRDVPAFNGTPMSPENIASYIWDQCCSYSLSDGQISALRMWWTPLSRIDIVKNGSMGTDMMTVTCCYEFSASHRLHSNTLSNEENAEIFGKCNRINGHGHNYEIEITFAGVPNSESGQIIPLDLVNKIVDEEIITPFDHRHLNIDVPEFKDLNPTSENLTKVIWDKIAARCNDLNIQPAQLYKVAVHETARNYFEYFGPVE